MERDTQHRDCVKGKISLSKDAYYFLLFLFVRLASVLIVQTWYVPDEYWQSLEVAHNMVFGYGYKTWEWKVGIRSYLHPLLVAILYKLLYLLNLDTVAILVTGPRLCQAVLSAYADLKFFQWCGHQKWAAFSIASSWFWFYTGSRTLINTFETCLSTIALSHFPWPGRENKGERFLWLVAVACWARPTAVLLWLPLCGYHILTAVRCERLRSATMAYAVVGTVMVVIGVTVDSLCHGSLVFTPWEFLRVNALEDVGSWYGRQPWYWYTAVGLPAVLGLHVVPLAACVWWAVRNPERAPATARPLLAAVAFVVLVLSLAPHKEFRFALPLLPALLHLSAATLASWSRRASRALLWAAATALLASNVVPAVYLGVVHQRASAEVMRPLSDLAAARPNDTSLLFLMPCHSTPLYSHLHVDVPARFLTCEPPLEELAGESSMTMNGTSTQKRYSNEGYMDEADQFYEEPLRWLHEQYPPDGALPTHIVTYDTLMPLVSSLLARYRPLHTFEHASVLLSPRTGYRILVHQHLDY